MKPLLSGYSSSFTQFIKDKAIVPVAAYFKQGLDSRKLSHSVAAGVVIGTIPIIGVSSILATFVGLKCRLFTALVMLITYLIYPIQMLLIIPFMKLGSLILGTKVGVVNATTIFGNLFKHPIDSLPQFGSLILGGLLAWSIVSIALYFGIYYGVLFISKNNKPNWAWVKPLYQNTIRPHFRNYGKYLDPRNYFVS